VWGFWVPLPFSPPPRTRMRRSRRLGLHGQSSWASPDSTRARPALFIPLGVAPRLGERSNGNDRRSTSMALAVAMRAVATLALLLAVVCSPCARRSSKPNAPSALCRAAAIAPRCCATRRRRPKSLDWYHEARSFREKFSRNLHTRRSSKTCRVGKIVRGTVAAWAIRAQVTTQWMSPPRGGICLCVQLP
jgi:hypothetical protein